MLSARTPAILLGLLIVGGLLQACRTGTPGLEASWREGYSLLHELLSRDAHADKILWVKFESDAVETLMTEIVQLCAEAAERIEEIADTDERVNLELEPLPAIELETRSEIESETAAELLVSSGAEFESRLLITQLRALQYAASLSRVIARHEVREDRGEFLERLAERCSAMRGRVLATLLGRGTASESATE